ncbi:MAG: hypothetical protein Q7I99_05670 [Acholeplasmataceae bacterium]|nr:hypothetical protein [Acholeplasmataceae bacterium]
MDLKEVQRIINMIYHHGRPLEEARIKHLLFGGEVKDVIIELRKFQNPDGGFAHSLEPDIWNPNSSPIQSFMAISILRELDFDSNEPMVNLLVNYLEESFDEEKLRWPLLYKSNDDYPHAPWWSYREESYPFNPSASIAGFILKYTNPLNKAFKYANKVAREAIDFINKTKEPIEVHELRCLIDLINDVSDLFKNYPAYKEAKTKMILHIDNILEKDTSKWFSDYVVKPSALIKTHPSLGSDVFFDLMLNELDLAMLNRNSEGIWDITWTWGDAYPGAAKEAAFIWQGIIALDYLHLMIKFGLLKLDTAREDEKVLID